MGFLKKAVGSLFGSSAPSYSQDAAAKSQVYGVLSDLGNMSVQKNKDGTYSKVYESSEADKARNALIGQGLGALSLDPTAVQNAYYNQATSLLDKQFGQQQENLDRNLINRGIQVGTEQYNTAMGNLTDSQNQTLQNLANQAVYMGTSNLGNQISNINALSGGRDINAIPSLSGSGNDSYNDAYKAQVYANTVKDTQNKNMLGGIGALAGSIYGLF